MAKEPCTMKTEVGMKEGGRMVGIKDREHTTQKMETSIQANGMIGKDKEKLNTRTERSIQDTEMVVISIISKDID